MYSKNFTNYVPYKSYRHIKIRTSSAQAKTMPLCVNLEDGTMKPLTSLFHPPVHSPLSHTHRMICIPIHRRSEIQSFHQWKYLFYKGLAHHQPTVSDGYTASIRPGVVSCSKSALILTNCVCIQSCKLRSLLVSVTLLKEFQAFLSFLIRNPLSEGRCSFFHAVLLRTK